MTATSADPTTQVWPYCVHGSGADGAGCRGRIVEPHTVCLAHLTDADRSAYLAGLQPGADLDHRGTSFTEELLSELLAALTDPATDEPHLGNAVFDTARFSGDAHFDGAKISGNASFCETEIVGNAWFYGTEIGGDARFDDAEIGGNAWFVSARISGDADFYRVHVGGDALFQKAQIAGETHVVATEIGGDAWFDDMEFGGDLWLSAATIRGSASLAGATFNGNVFFHSTVFERTAQVGPLVCAGTLDVSEAVFHGAVTIEASTAALQCTRTRWASTAALRLRHTAVDLSDAVLEYPVSIAARARPFIVNGLEMPEPDSTDLPVQVVSLRGVDAAHLVLTDVDLTDCLFVGTIHLDQLRLEGRCLLAPTPSGLRRRGVWPVRCTPRQTLAEEHHWRATRTRGADGWVPAPEGEAVLDPAALAPVYRQLRKAFEDGKDEPGAADFYYGEMEMRRHDPGTPRAERALIAAYWALSGYGLRASRALGWLLATMTATVLAMMLWGLPQDDPKPQSTGTLTGRTIAMTTDTPDPANPHGPYAQRMSTVRFEKSMRVVINSVVFRSSGQDLTTAGTYTEMASRLVEPALLGLAVLAVRSRVKR
ncbi:pentapeptide repeat-containing protein [Streptomyces sp. NPDC059866]|uniref:pentapeptide repeat-containing protein n=1 Tax=Streptomyces sp. NPDC059866 TaxID=3346978 RepID=UPI00366706C9